MGTHGFGVRVPARAWTQARRPAEMVEATRWLFCVLALVSLLIGLAISLATADPWLSLVSSMGALLLGVSCAVGYLRRSVPLAWDLTDSVALFAMAVAAAHPATVLGFVFASLWFRSLYGSAARAALRCGLYVLALSASLALSHLVPGHSGSSHVGELIGAFPTMVVTVIVGRHLASILRGREQSAARDAVQVAVGAQLLGVTDPTEIRRIGWWAVARICDATPGLRVLKVVREASALRVDGASGGFAGLPETLPGVVVPQGVSGRLGRRAGVEITPELDAAAGEACMWSCVPIPDRRKHASASSWLLFGAPSEIPAEAEVSLISLINQVALAVHNSEVHDDLTRQATRDSLTGLVNRATFISSLQMALGDDPAWESTVIFVDLDDFKDVNDVFGHSAGDELLRLVATRLSQTTRPEDLCARIGGDQFAVLLRGTGAGVAAEVAQRIVQAVAAPAYVGADVAYLGASVGVATATGQTDLEELIREADVAMYAAKASGKARFQVFEPALLGANAMHLVFERQLAAAANNGELVVHYQPILSLTDGRCIAAEALVRWDHPERGLLYPDAFIADAERIGAIRDIGAYVLRRACAAAASWREAYPTSPLSVHVNVSALQLDDDGFVDSVIRCLRDFALPAEQLVLEFTETVVISSRVAIDRLNAVSAHGVTIAIDDFGTGYSALTTLRTLPVQIVKIDKSFVAGSTDNAEDRAVTEAIVRLGATMGLLTVAEGVETLVQQQFLQEIGADGVQGYLYARPAGAEGFVAWLAAHIAALAKRDPEDGIVLPSQRQTA